MQADLHLHTIESDGTWTPQQLVQEALERSLAVIAITDHDTTAGIAEALAAAPRGLEVVPGIEISSVSEGGEEVHILGLWIDPHSEALQAKLTILRDSRFERTAKILKRLAELGLSLTESDVRKYAHKDVLSRSHVASALVEKGYVQTKQEAFQRFIGVGAPAYVDRYKISPEEAVQLILKAGGVPVLAHPGLLKDLELIPSLVEAGLVGIEVVHSTHTPTQEEFFSNLAKSFGLLPAGGSDCHGPGGKDKLFIGDFTIPLKWVEDLAARR